MSCDKTIHRQFSKEDVQIQMLNIIPGHYKWLSLEYLNLIRKGNFSFNAVAEKSDIPDSNGFKKSVLNNCEKINHIPDTTSNIYLLLLLVI